MDWTTGMVEYWNGGLGNFCSCFHYLSYYIYFLYLCYTFCVAGFPDLRIVDTYVAKYK